jgi:hypothetical protein
MGKLLNGSQTCQFRIQILQITHRNTEQQHRKIIQKNHSSDSLPNYKIIQPPLTRLINLIKNIRSHEININQSLRPPL